jgi:hypothetical protein
MGRFQVPRKTTTTTTTAKDKTTEKKKSELIFRKGIPISSLVELVPALTVHKAIRIDDTATHCVLGQLDHWTVVPKYSKNNKSVSHSSDSIVVLGTKGPYRIAMKMGMQEKGSDGHTIPELEYERRIYKQLINPIVGQRYTPNLILYIGDMVCNALALKETIKDREFLQQYRQLQRKQPQSTRMVSLVMEGLRQFATVDSFLDAIKNERHLQRYQTALQFQQSSNIYMKKIPAILWQTLYTCFCLKHLKLLHYDLHLQNVAVEADTRGTPFHRRSIIYVLDRDHVYRVNTQNCLVKFYDWDFGYSPELGPNDKLLESDSFCRAYGRCNDLTNPNYDVIHFLASVLSAVPELYGAIEAITGLDANSWMQYWPVYGQRVPKEFSQHFEPEKMLKSPFFQRFRYRKPIAGSSYADAGLVFFSPRLTGRDRKAILEQ